MLLESILATTSHAETSSVYLEQEHKIINEEYDKLFNKFEDG